MGKIENLLVKQGLYDSIDINIEDLEEIENYLTSDLYSKSTIDCFCIHCGVNRVFERKSFAVYQVPGANPALTSQSSGRSPANHKQEDFKDYLNKRYALTYICARESKHYISFYLTVTTDKVIKIGQYPSVADLVIPEIAKYKSVLDKQFLEFSKGVGLFAHGVGIGSFVYLRRVIEKLVFDKYEQFSDELGVTSEEFVNFKFDVKIAKLSNHLPLVLVKNKNVYGILSKGVHELSEDECLRMFPFIKAGIELILDELLAEKERAGKEKIFENFVAQKTGESRHK